MTVRHLRIFAAVVDCGTMHAAAQKLYLSQPTITQAIKELEEHYGCLLFERYGRRLMITPAGQELLGHARELLSVYERMERSMKQNAGQKLLRIGATVVLAEQLLVPMVQAFEAQNPEIRVEVLVDNSSVLESRLLSGELDAALLDSAGRSSEVQLRPLPAGKAGGGGGTLPSAGPVHRPGDGPAAGGLRFYPPGGGQYAPAASGCLFGPVWPFAPDQVACTNLHTVVQAVQAGMGISVLSPVLMREELAAGTLREIPVEDFAEVREISAAVRRGRSDYAPLERFLDFCQEQSAQL